MSQPTVSFNPDANLEAEAAFDWYYERSPHAAHAFLQELNHAISCVCETPERWPEYGKTCRRYIFPRFPFQLIYRFVDNTVEIVAVAHGRRRPNYWKGRDKR
jgi:plasmid stabilization system protein ParE